MGGRGICVLAEVADDLVQPVADRSRRTGVAGVRVDVEDHLDAVEAVADAARPSAHLPDGPLSLELRAVSFAFGDSLVLDGVAFSVSAGETVALVGSTGSGKSTLAQLLVRLDEPTGGEVLLGGVPIDSLDPNELRSAVSLAFQESYLFASPVRDNVTLGRDVDDERTADALDRARAARFARVAGQRLRKPPVAMIFGSSAQAKRMVLIPPSCLKASMLRRLRRLITLSTSTPKTTRRCLRLGQAPRCKFRRKRTAIISPSATTSLSTATSR